MLYTVLTNFLSSSHAVHAVTGVSGGTMRSYKSQSAALTAFNNAFYDGVLQLVP